jgi:hypothetical protein
VNKLKIKFNFKHRIVDLFLSHTGHHCFESVDSLLIALLVAHQGTLGLFEPFGNIGELLEVNAHGLNEKQKKI